MYSLTTGAFLAQLLLFSTNAQNSTAGTCKEIEDSLRYNASTTRQIQAYSLEGQNPRTPGVIAGSPYKLVNDSSRTWDLSLRVQRERWANSSNMPENPSYLQTMFLDTKDSNMTDIGTCHQTIQASVNRAGYSWTKAVMERSLKDNGDCTTLLGDECVAALKRNFIEAAANWPLRAGKCAGMSNSMPQQCSGVGSMLATQQLNNTYVDGVRMDNPNSRFSPDTECNGVNASSTHTVTVGERMAYNDAVRFPIIDVISFWPNRSSGFQTSDNNWVSDVRVEVLCMRPDEKIAEGSSVPPSAQDLLNVEGAKFRTESGALGLKQGTLGWMCAAVMGVMLVL